MSERWRQFITGGVEGAETPHAFALEQWRFLYPVFEAIRRRCRGGGRILDVGCGAGIFTALVAHHGYEVTGIDEDAEIVGYANRIADGFQSKARVEQASAFDLSAYRGAYDLVFSLGVVEHFEPQDTIELIAEQARCAPVVLVAVPTRYTRHAGEVSDERLYRRGQVDDLVSRAGLRVRESFVYGDVPTTVAVNLERLLPGVLYRQVQHRCSYGMGICVVGER